MTGSASSPAGGSPSLKAQPSDISTASSASSSNGPTALSSSEALHRLLSPDGYYTYLNIQRPEAVGGIGGIDGKAGADATNGIDVDLVKKNYRRLSLRHHPDRRGGDAETFRVLNRAKLVLTSPKLRKQYDLLGLDLDDDADDHPHEEGTGGGGDADGGGGDGDDAKKEQGEEGAGKEADTIVSHLASATLATILQVAVRTAMMATVSTLICRYKLLIVPAVLLLAFISYRVYETSKRVPGSVEVRDYISPIVISAGICMMHAGHSEGSPWSWTFWFGEAMVMTMFISNSVPVKTSAVLIAFAVLSFIVTLLLRGKFWRYASVIGCEAGLAVVAVLVFPIMEMILEEIMNEKMRKVGEKIRAHAKRMESSTAATSNNTTK